MGIEPEAFRKMQERLDRNRAKPYRPPAPIPVTHPMASVVMADLDAFDAREFTYNGAPMGKPRMTRRDKFVKRPKTQRYWAFKDAIRAVAGDLPSLPDLVLVTAYVAMPKSWSKKKTELLNGKPCRQRPDWDNIGKAVCDSLFDEDCCIWLGLTAKYWCRIGEERVNVRVLYAKS